jgi:hypothetical protein
LLFFSNHYYSDYTIYNFLAGIKIYHDKYIIGIAGDAYNSSLFALIKLVFGYSKAAELFCLVYSIFNMIIAIIGYQKMIFNRSNFVLLLCISCMFSTPIFADYHLLIFFFPLFAINFDNESLESNDYKKQEKIFNWIVFVICLLILSPKNYLISNGVPKLILLNPIIGIITSILFFSYLVKITTKNFIKKQFNYR